MSVAGMHRESLRQERAESSRLVWAFAISMALHLLLFGGYHTGKKLHWWENMAWPAWLSPVKKLTEALQKKPDTAQPLRPQEPPLLFVEVNPVQETIEPPKNAQYYSSRNSQAANPEPEKDTDVPKITGEQTKVRKTEDVPRSKPMPLQPTPPPQAQQAPQEQDEAKAKPTQVPGDLAVGKPEPKPEKSTGEAPRSRPRTIKEALARLPDSSRLAGEKMKQEGGVKRHLELSSFNAKATPFGAYDYAFIQAVQQRWYALLDSREYASDSRGKVVLQFNLHSDGRITAMKVTENTVGEVLGLICQKAVLDPAPYAAWSKEMRLNMEDPRNVQFTFYYD
ncbi:MAG TPA: hypothetical protein VEC99_03280 [Clostridia bacterium]|nr:hypothetical protein [Clostridia bacterium]